MLNSKRITRNAQRRFKLPFVFVNMAMTADGKIATANRAVSFFGSKRDRDHLLELRATADAVMAGARTVDSAKINMGPGPARHRRLRVKRGLAEYNVRVIVSRSGSINPKAEIFKHRFAASNNLLTRSRRGGTTLSPTGGEAWGEGALRFIDRAGVRGILSRTQARLTRSPIVILTTRRANRGKLEMLHALADEVKVCGTNEINFQRALRWLRDKWGIKRLLCEGGGELNDALFRTGLVDELHLTICPKILGGRNAPTIADGIGVLRLAGATRLKLKSATRVGDELFLVFKTRRKTA